MQIKIQLWPFLSSLFPLFIPLLITTSSLTFSSSSCLLPWNRSLTGSQFNCSHQLINMETRSKQLRAHAVSSNTIKIEPSVNISGNYRCVCVSEND